MLSFQLRRLSGREPRGVNVYKSDPDEILGDQTIVKLHIECAAIYFLDHAAICFLRRPCHQADREQ